MASKKRFLLIAIIFGIALGLGGYFYYQSAVNRANSDSDGIVRFTIQSGQGVSEIAESLYANRLINSPFFFKICVKFNNLATGLQAGEYAIPQNLSIKEVADALQKGVFDRRLTFIEGWRREEMVSYLVKEMGIEFAKDFLAASEGKEGHLFPDTYFAALGTEALELVERMTDNFEKKLAESSGSLSGSRSSKGLEERIILASIVEREVLFSEDRPIVAGILWKRYQNDWPLEADATVQYAVAESRIKNYELRDGYFELALRSLGEGGWWPEEITAEDLEIDSPYNTRKYAGLPPTPICNPGLGSLEAAINPQTTPYWFYVSDPEGHIRYAETIEEHNENVARVVR